MDPVIELFKQSGVLLQVNPANDDASVMEQVDSFVKSKQTLGAA